MSFFPLPHYATRVGVSVVTERSGQDKETLFDVGTFPCLYKAMRGRRDTDLHIEFYQMGWLFLNPETELEEGDRIRDITTIQNGLVVEAGLFLVDTIKNIPTLTGLNHHKTCRLIGVGHDA